MTISICLSEVCSGTAWMPNSNFWVMHGVTHGRRIDHLKETRCCGGVSTRVPQAIASARRRDLTLASARVRAALGKESRGKMGKRAWKNEKILTPFLPSHFLPFSFQFPSIYPDIALPFYPFRPSFID